MNILKRSLLRVGLALLLATTGTAANAQFAVIDAAVTAAVTASTTAIVAAVETTTAAVTAGATSINTLANTNFQQLYQVIKGVGVEGAQATNEAAKMVAQANTRTAFEVVRAASIPRYTVTNPCAVIAAASGMASVNRDAAGAGSSFGRGGTGSTGVRAGAGGASADLARAIAISKGSEAAPAPEVTAKLAASGACSAFATGTRATACAAAQFATGQANPFADADVRADTLFDGPQATGQRRKKFTIDDADGSSERVALESFVRNMGTPLEMRALGRGELGTDAGRRYLAVKDGYEARMSFAERPMRRQIGMMAPSADTRPVLERLLTGLDSQWVTEYLNRASPNWRTRGISSDDLMNLEVERRYMNRGWMTRVGATMPPEELAREQLMTTALQNVLLWKLNLEVRETGILLGGLNATAVRSESLPELKSAHAAAAR